MDAPTGLAFDSVGFQLWITGRDNHRILRSENPALKADGVLLQPTFTEASNTATPTGVAMRRNGRLIVTSNSGNRVL